MDERAEAADPKRFAELRGTSVRRRAPGDAAEDVSVRAPGIVATHDHGLDAAAIVWAVGRGHDYVGGAGSKAKEARVKALLEERGVARETIDRVRMPVGLAIGGSTPEEIALLIAAELVAWRHGRGPELML